MLASDVVRAICAVGDEAARRGEMYPQTSDEQREDKCAVRRVVEMLRWYEKNTGCANLKGWPAKKPVVYQATEPDGEPRWGDDAFSDCATAFPHSRALCDA